MSPRLVTAALALFLLCPGPATGQPDLDLRLTPRLGMVTPAGWFYEEFAHLGVDPLEWTEAAILESTAAGLTVEVEVEDTGLWIRGEVLRTLGGEVRLGHKILNSTSGNTQPTISSVYHWLPATLTLTTLDLGLPTRFRLPFGIQPYVTAGLGAKHYSFDTSVIDRPPRTLELPRDGATFVVNVGGGFTLDIRGLTVDLVARDAISEYWDEQQHDVFWLVGLSWQIF